MAYHDTCYRTDVVEVPSTCEGYRCTGGAGESEAWNRYFGADKEDKPTALADAIKGVGQVTALKLIGNGYFASKPRSWDAFVAELQRAADGGVIGADIVYQATVRYKAENLTNLGYDAGTCSTYTYPCSAWEERTVPYACVKYRDEPRQSVIESITRTVTLDVAPGATLQPFEADAISVEVGHEPSQVQVTAGPFNRYNVSTQIADRALTVQAAPAERLHVALPRATVQTGKLLNKDGGLRFWIRVDAKYLGIGSDQLILKYTVNTCQKKLFGACMGGFTPQAEESIPLTQADTTLPIVIDRKQKAKVVYTVVRKNSRWYDETPLAPFETDAEGRRETPRSPFFSVR